MSPIVERLVKLEQRCLLSLSRAARAAQQKQIALNSIMRALQLGDNSDVAQEYAKVLWDISEPSLAVEHLRKLVHGSEAATSQLKVNIISQLVRTRSNHQPATSF